MVRGYSDQQDSYVVFAVMERRFPTNITGYATIADINGEYDDQAGQNMVKVNAYR